jgi:hypothetical protein
MATEPPVVPLPSATILNYISRADMTPTRVRILAARLVWIAAAAYLLATCFFAYGTVADFLDLQAQSAGAPLKIVLEEFWDDEAPLPIAFVLFFTLTILAATMAAGVKRGRKGPAIIALFVVIPLGFLFLALAGMLAIFAIFVGFAVGEVRGGIRPLVLLLFIPAAIAVVLCLLVKDLCAYLFWIARHPDAEKPPIQFLPGRPAS